MGRDDRRAREKDRRFLARAPRGILRLRAEGFRGDEAHRRVREYFGGDPTPQMLLDVPDEVLRAAGVSGNKAKAMKDLAAKTIDGTVPSHSAILKMPDADIVERLTAVRGIGPWTVEMLLIFRLGRPDVLPVTDYGVRKGYALTFMRVPKSRPLAAEDLPKPDVVTRRAEKWRPFRSVASWYMWRACDLSKSPSAPPGVPGDRS